MPSPPALFDASFLASQRLKLIDTRTALSASIDRDATEDGALASAGSGQANEVEDRAQDASIADNNRSLVAVLRERRASIDRALAKIDEGTYGYSDLSGQPIALERLVSYPEAIRTASEV
jgi:DnaK suppressor protein